MDTPAELSGTEDLVVPPEDHPFWRIPRGTGERAVALELEARGWVVDQLWEDRRDPPDLRATKNGITVGIEVKTCNLDRAGAAKRPKEKIDFEFKASDWVASDFFILCLLEAGTIRRFFVMRKDEPPVGPIVKVTTRTRFLMNESHIAYPDWAQHLNRFDKLG